jgi:putative oxidoreductase
MGKTSARDVGLLVLRTAMGSILFVHGAQKLFGWFGGHGIAGTAVGWEKIGFTPGKANVVAAGLGTAGGGALLALGLATPAAGAAIAGTMAVAAEIHVPGGFFAHEEGYEYVAFLGIAAAAVVLTGPGELSADELLGHRLNQPWMRPIALAAVVPAAAAVVRRRRKALAAAKQVASQLDAEPEAPVSA